MKKYFTISTSPTQKVSKEAIDFNTIKLPGIGLGFLNKSVQQLKKELIEKLDYEKALKRLDISPSPSKYRNPFKSKPEPLFKTTLKRNKWAHDYGLDEFIDSMFFSVNNSYHLLSKDMAAPIDYFTAELQLKNLKRLKPIIKGVEADEVDKTPLENFWIKNISESHIVRWDIFEEALCRHFILNINTSIGKIRKINWDLLLKKLLKNISSKSNELEFWPGHPGLSPIIYDGAVVLLSNFQQCITSGKFKALISKTIGVETFYLGERYKKNTFVFACGAEYQGEWKGYRRDGLGKLILANGAEYEGYFYKGFRHGYGTCAGLKCSYKGYWDEEFFDGPGEMTYYDLSSLDGIWKNGKVISGKLKFAGGEYTGYFNSYSFEGSGIYINKQGDIKKGNWHKGKLCGNGEISLKNGSTYIGVFIDDFLDGKGSIDTPSYSYTGDVKQSLPDGEGVMVFKNINCKYEGGFIEGVINGKGVYRIDNAVLKGEFVHGKLTGKGEETIGTSSKFVGEFSDSMMHGKGVLRIAGDNFKGIYNGEFRLNKFHGVGRLKLENNEYRGEFVNGEMHGVGELILDNCHFRGGLFKGEIHGKGSVHFYDGSYYDGEWVEGKLSGSGEALDPHGYWIASNFIDGKPISRHRLRNDFFSNIEDFRGRFKKFLEYITWIQTNIFIPLF